MMRAVCVLALLATGCPPDLGEFHVIGDGGDPSCSTCECPFPVLLVAVGSMDGSDSTAGQVLRFSLADGSTSPCGALDGGGTLSSYAWTVGWAPGAGGEGLVLFGEETKVRALDPARDAVVWTWTPTSGGCPHDITRVAEDGVPRIVVAAAMSVFDEDIRTVAVLDQDGQDRVSWDLNGSSPLLLGLSIYSVTASVLDPSHLFATKSGDYAAADVRAPFDGVTATPQTYVAALATGAPRSLYTGVAEGARRVAFTRRGFTTDPDELYAATDEGGGPQLAGPLVCGLAECVTPNRFSHAVPDPKDATRLLAICDGDAGGQVRHVVRVGQDGTCELVFDGRALPALSQPRRLAIAP